MLVGGGGGVHNICAQRVLNRGATVYIICKNVFLDIMYTLRDNNHNIQSCTDSNNIHITIN